MFLTALHSAVLVLCSQALTLQSFIKAFEWAADNFGCFCLSLLLVSTAGFLFYGLFKKAWAAQIPASIAVLLLTLVSYYKNIIRNSPLELADFTLAGQFGNIAGFALSVIKISFVTAVSVLLPLLLLWAMSRWEKKHPAKDVQAWASLFLSLILTFSLTFSFAFPAVSVQMGVNCEDQTGRVAKMGVPLGLYSALSLRNTYKVDFGDLDPEDFLTITDEIPKEGLPDIILILSESFYDITKIPNLEFSEDPLADFRTLQDNYTNGTFYSDNCFGGTGHVEMAVFSGISRFLLQEGDTLSALDPAAYETMPTIVRNLKDAGYSTTAMHSYTSALYNRSVIYPRIGFDRLVFSDSFPDTAEKRGPYISDDSFADEIISLYEERDKSKPFFLYGISMENHSPYTYGKFGFDSDIKVTSSCLSEKEIRDVEAFVIGLEDEDKALKKLTDYFKDREEPVLIACFGDHCPSIPFEEGNLYSKTGYCSTEDTADYTKEDLVKVHSTEYLIWTNYEKEPQPDRDIGLCSFGVEILKRAGIPLYNYFKLADREILSNITLYRSRLFIDKFGTAYSSVPDGAEEIMARARQIVGAVVYNNR